MSKKYLSKNEFRYNNSTHYSKVYKNGFTFRLDNAKKAYRAGFCATLKAEKRVNSINNAISDFDKDIKLLSMSN